MITKNDIINWDRLKYLVIDAQPDIIDCSIKKTPIPIKLRQEYYERDDGICYLCGKQHPYGSNNPFLKSCGERNDYNLSNLHHIVPNGGNEDTNIVTLCIRCHQLVHLLMYIEGTWCYAMPR